MSSRPPAARIAASIGTGSAGSTTAVVPVAVSRSSQA